MTWMRHKSLVASSASLRMSGGLALVWALCVLLAMEALAQESEPTAPPARVGQLAMISGNVRMRVDRTAAWEQAVLNTPVTTGSAVATQLPGRIEVRIGSAALHLGQDSRVEWTEVNDNNLHVEIVSGLVALRVRALAQGERVLLSIKGVTVQVLRPGSYRFRYTPLQARLRVWVLEGQARVTLSQPDFTLDRGQQVQIDNGTSKPFPSSANDDHQSFDEFADGRDQGSESSLSRKHVSAEVTGIEALDGHGNWQDVAGYGVVWFPNKLPADWAPYRFGRWRWLAPWGWTWIDDAPWGFAPSHYGRWLFAGGRWGWVPSKLTVANPALRPVYAPAVVDFFGSPAGAVWSSPGMATPVVGWYPLAPGEIYWPSYSSQTAYVRALNASSVSDVSQLQGAPAANDTGLSHRFARTAFAATAMSYTAFSSMQEVSANQVVLRPAALALAPLSGRRLQPPPPDVATRSSPTQ
jgi:hypothetical protein